jgi:RNA polymerase sigma-70 factor (ECF subfamily)
VTDEDYRAFYAAAFPRLVGQVYLLTGDLGEAQDVVQEAFIRAWARRRRFTDGDEPDAWIRTVARRLAVSRWRSARSALAAWRRHGPVADTPAPSVDNPLIVAALQQLPEDQRRAIVLYHLCDLSVDQVAAETGVPAGTVKARLSRGRAALRRILGVPDPRYSIIGTDDIVTAERRHA